MTTQKEFPALIASRTPFEGSSVAATKDDDNNYRVFSYDTLIARWDEGDDLMYFDETMYSSTTRKIQNLIRNLEG